MMTTRVSNVNTECRLSQHEHIWKCEEQPLYEQKRNSVNTDTVRMLSYKQPMSNQFKPRCKQLTAVAISPVPNPCLSLPPSTPVEPVHTRINVNDQLLGK